MKDEIKERLTSVIIPAHNSRDCIGIAIESVLSQTRAPYEIIVIDDGSTDGTSAIAERYSDKVRLLRQENKGQGAARNAGMAEAKGRFLSFLDADDKWEPAFLEHMERFLVAHPEAIAASCGISIHTETGTIFLPPNHETLLAANPDGFMLEDFFAHWADNDHVRTGTVLFRHEATLEIGFQNADLRISQDLEYWALLGTLGPWGMVPRPLWVGRSRIRAKKVGWRQRYADRRKRTPTVEQWQARILPRLSKNQMGAFYKVRGRVASGYALSHVLGGNSATGRKILHTYGKEMPGGTSLRLLKLGDRFGHLGWWTVCQMLRFHDAMK